MRWLVFEKLPVLVQVLFCNNYPKWDTCFFFEFPTLVPSVNPTSSPSSHPTLDPTSPSLSPTFSPTRNPTTSNATFECVSTLVSEGRSCSAPYLQLDGVDIETCSEQSFIRGFDFFSYRESNRRCRIPTVNDIASCITAPETHARWTIYSCSCSNNLNELKIELFHNICWLSRN